MRELLELEGGGRRGPVERVLIERPGEIDQLAGCEVGGARRGRARGEREESEDSKVAVHENEFCHA
jgi:hypothetical protein